MTVALPDIKLEQRVRSRTDPGADFGEKKNGFLGKLKKDLEKDSRESAVIMKSKNRMEEESIKTLQRIDELKLKVRSWMADLGGRVYELSDRIENPMHDMKVEMMVARIKKLESQIRQLETGSKKE